MKVWIGFVNHEYVWRLSFKDTFVKIIQKDYDSPLIFYWKSIWIIANQGDAINGFSFSKIKQNKEIINFLNANLFYLVEIDNFQTFWNSDDIDKLSKNLPNNTLHKNFIHQITIPLNNLWEADIYGGFVYHNNIQNLTELIQNLTELIQNLHHNTSIICRFWVENEVSMFQKLLSILPRTTKYHLKFSSSYSFKISKCPFYSPPISL